MGEGGRGYIYIFTKDEDFLFQENKRQIEK